MRATRRTQTACVGTDATAPRAKVEGLVALTGRGGSTPLSRIGNPCKLAGFALLAGCEAPIGASVGTQSGDQTVSAAPSAGTPVSCSRRPMSRCRAPASAGVGPWFIFALRRERIGGVSAIEREAGNVLKLLASIRGQWIGALALFLVLSGGVAYAADTIGSADVINNSLLSEDLANNKAVKSADVYQRVVDRLRRCGPQRRRYLPRRQRTPRPAVRPASPTSA